MKYTEGTNRAMKVPAPEVKAQLSRLSAVVASIEGASRDLSDRLLFVSGGDAYQDSIKCKEETDAGTNCELALALVEGCKRLDKVYQYLQQMKDLLQI